MVLHTEKMKNKEILDAVSSLYKKAGLLTRLHVCIRLKTSPFLIIEKHLPREGLIIDYGCGHGVFSHLLSLLSPERRIYGVDLSEAKIKEAGRTLKHGDRVSFCADCNIWQILREANTAVIIDVLSYLTHQERLELLKNFYNNLKSGAILVIKDQNKELSPKFLFLYLQEILAIKIFKITESKGLYSFNKEYLSELLKGIGFNVEVQDLSKGYLYPHVAFICRKI